jgi:hypothetical protein
MSDEKMTMQFLVAKKYVTEAIYAEVPKWQIQVEYSSYAQHWQDIVQDVIITLQ